MLRLIKWTSSHGVQSVWRPFPLPQSSAMPCMRDWSCSDVPGEKWWLRRVWQATCWASLIRHRRLLSLLSTEALTSATTESHCHTSVFNGLWMGAAHSDERARVCVCEGSNFTCSIRQLFEATRDKMRYDEVTGDLTSSLSLTYIHFYQCGSSYTHTHTVFLIITQCG